MIASLRPAAALLAAIALWSLAVLLLAFAGLGAQVGPHPDNQALMPAMPVVQLDSVGSRLGPPSEYLEIASRPLMNRDRRPVAIAAASGSESDKPLEAMLTSVLISGDFRMAILQGRDDGVSRRVRLGDVLEGTSWRLVDLQPRHAVFEGPQGRTELDLRVFDGQGGAAPTPVATVPPSASQTAGAPAGGPKPAPAAAPGVVATSGAPGAAAQPAPDAAAPITPEQQVEAIRRRIEARRAMRAAQAEQDQASPAPQQQVQ